MGQARRSGAGRRCITARFRRSTEPSGSRLRCSSSTAGRTGRSCPLMSEKMIEALEIEGKFHEVRWYDEEAHGWQARENRRDAFTRIPRPS